MYLFEKNSLIKFSPLLLIALVLVIAAFTNPTLFKNENDQKVSAKKVPASESAGQNISTSTASNSADIKINNNVKGTDTQSGTCTVTKNGKTEIVPSGSVNVNEKSSDDINVKVDCKTSINQNSSNRTSINNNVDVKVNSGN